MFVVKIEDSGNHSEDFIIQIEDCLWTCLKSRSKKILEEGENQKGGDLQSELQSYLGAAPHVMGSLFDGVSYVCMYYILSYQQINKYMLVRARITYATVHKVVVE